MPQLPQEYQWEEIVASFDSAEAVEPPPNDEWVATRFPALDWHAVFERAPEEPEWVVQDLFLAGRSYALVAAAKVGKSLLMLDVCAALATGRSALGHPARTAVRVLYVDLENTESDLADRLRDLGYTPDDLGQLAYLSFPSLDALDTKEGGQQLDAAARYYRAELVVIDTLSRVVDGDENEARTYQAFYRHAVVAMKARGVTVVRLDHLGKDAAKGARGSSAKSDDVDGVWLLEPKDGGVQLRLERQRSNHHPEVIPLERQNSPLRHVATAVVPKAEIDLGQLLVVVKSSGEMGVTVREATIATFGEFNTRLRLQMNRALDKLDKAAKVEKMSTVDVRGATVDEYGKPLRGFVFRAA
ncbi:AAA family ATPase [Rhodococcus erythropolis]|nr:AAA family ATPase [Rhodococcus erythropolis]